MEAVWDGRGVRMALVMCGWLLALFSIMAPSVLAAEEPKYELKRSFGPDGTSSTGFSKLGPIAVDQEAHLVYVLDRGTGILYKFDPEGKTVPFSGSAAYISGNKISGLDMSTSNNAERQVGVDSTSHKLYVTDGNSIRAFQASGEPALFSAGPGSGTNLIGGFTRLSGLTVDASGFIYASDRDADLVKVFAPSGEEVTQFAVTDPRNLAIDNSGAAYVNRQGITPLKYTPSIFPVTGATTYAAAAEPLGKASAFAITIDPATNNVYLALAPFEPAQVAVYDEDGLLLKTFAGPGEEGDVIFITEGVTVDGSKKLAFVSRFAGDFAPEDLSQVEIFDIKGDPEEPPTIQSTAATSITADSATLRARINPNLAETTYRFEYGLEDCALSACASVPFGGGTLPAVSEFLPASIGIEGLEPATTYHYRVVAENEFNEIEEKAPSASPDKTFVTQADGLGFELADSRAWEMVSPVDKSGAELQGAAFEGPVQAAADGNGLAYLSAGSIEADPDGNRLAELSSILARRGVGGGWSSRDVTPANGNVSPITSGQVFKLFTPDLSRALVQPHGMNPLSANATERTPYLRGNTEPATYTPLVTGKEGIANVPPGTEFGGPAGDPDAPTQIRGANTAQSDVVLRSTAALAAGAPESPEQALYHWRGGELSPLSVLPAAEGGAFVSAQVLGSGGGTVQNAISEDGSRIFWSRGLYTAAGNSLTGLYARETDAEETARLDAVSGGSGAGAARPVFVGASAEGTVVYFTDTQQLTADASPTKADLYRCEIPPGAAPPGCITLTNISGAAVEPGKSAGVLGLPLALSEDGRRIYFVATGVLDAGANPQGDVAVEGEPNLYLWEEGEGVRFIATLSGADERNWGRGGTSSIAEGQMVSAAGSPSGRFLTFMSELSLAGEDNVDPVSGEAVERVFRYDAASAELACISCDPAGGAPAGEVLGDALLVDPRGQWLDRRVGATVPQPIFDIVTGATLYKPRAALDNGRAFFNAIDPLVPADSNGEWDVYEYEPLGVGSCSASSGDAGTARSGAGCVSLISSGAGKEEVGFLDASTSGDDVFFLTLERLSALDKDDEADVYDARVNGVEAVLEPEAGCIGEACRAAAPQPTYPSAATAIFQGAGNLKPQGKPCPKGKKKAKRKGRVVCIPKKKPKKQAKKQKKKRTSQNGRAGR